MKPVQSYGNPLIDWVKDHTQFLLDPFAKVLHKIGVSPNFATSLSFLTGIFAAYFLFKDFPLFLTFAIAHFIFDLFDGAVARISKKVTTFGRWFDYGTDRTVTLLLLIQCAFFLQDELIFWIIIIYIIHHLIYILHKGDIILFYSRSVLLFSLMLGYTWFGLLFAGFVSAIGVLAQILIMAEKTYGK